MDNHLLPMGNSFSSQIEVIGFAPMETVNSIQEVYDRSLFLDSEWSSSILSHSLVLVIDTGKIVSFVLAHDLNESHIHPSTCSSTLRTSSKSWGFRDISDWLSCVSNKLFNSWHAESYTEWAGLDRS
jgi:hypothetical protein